MITIEEGIAMLENMISILRTKPMHHFLKDIGFDFEHGVCLNLETEDPFYEKKGL